MSSLDFPLRLRLFAEQPGVKRLVTEKQEAVVSKTERRPLPGSLPIAVVPSSPECSERLPAGVVRHCWSPSSTPLCQ